MQKRELLTISAVDAGNSLVGDNTLQLQSDPVSSSKIKISLLVTWQFLMLTAVIPRPTRENCWQTMHYQWLCYPLVSLGALFSTKYHSNNLTQRR